MEAIAEKLGDQTRMFMEFYLVPVLRAWNDQTPFIDYMEDRWESVKEPVSILIKHGVDKMIPKIKQHERQCGSGRANCPTAGRQANGSKRT